MCRYFKKNYTFAKLFILKLQQQTLHFIFNDLAPI